MSDTSIPKVLARNSACHQCRKRKLKCDAQKPTCANCLKPRMRNAGKDDSPADEEACTWDSPKEPSARTRRRRESAKRQAGSSAPDSEDDESDVKAKKAKLAELEGRIVACQTALDAQRSVPVEANTTYTGTSTQFSYQPANIPHVPGIEDWMPSYNPSPAKEYAPYAETVQQDASGIPMDSFAGFFDLTWPDWPRDLPSSSIVDRIVRVFFEKVPSVSRMINKSELLQALLLPPSHPQFPAQPLLHAILAITSFFISETSLATRAYFPIGASRSDITHPEYDFEATGLSGSAAHGGLPSHQHKMPFTPLTRFQLWHRRKAFVTFSNYIERGDKFLQCIQSYTIATMVDQYNAWWTDLWLETGACVRMCTPLRINESPNYPEGSMRRRTNLMIEPAQTPIAQAERDRTWWTVYVLERSATSATTWPTSIADDEITVELPVLQSTYDSGYGDLTGVQTFGSPDLLTSHPERHQDSLCFLIKALKLLTDVNTFFRRYSRGVHTIAGYLTHPTFRVILSQINSFRMSFPPQFRRPAVMKPTARGADDALDRELILALWVTHGASMCLGEPLITPETWTDEGARMTLAAIRASLSLLYDVTATSYDITLFPPHSSYVWSLASRCLVRFIDAASASGDQVSASVFRSEIDVFRIALTRYGERFPLGNRHLRMVDELLEQLKSNRRIADTHDLSQDCVKEELARYGNNKSTLKGTLAETSSTRSVETPGTSSSTPLDTYSFNSTSIFLQQGNKAHSGPAEDSPAMMDTGLDNGWDISSFSFDVNAVASLFESTGATFDGSDFLFQTV